MYFIANVYSRKLTYAAVGQASYMLFFLLIARSSPAAWTLVACPLDHYRYCGDAPVQILTMPQISVQRVDVNNI